MDNRIEAAMQAKVAAQQALELADQELRAAAKAKLDEAVALCKMAGVTVRAGVQPKPRSEESRRRASEASKRRWAEKSPEDRAAWAAKVTENARRGREALAVQ